MTTQGHNEVASPGGGIAGRIAKVTADASVYARQKMGPHTKAVAISALGDFTDLMSDESKEAIAPLLELLRKSPELGPEVRALVDFVTTKRGQWQMFVAGSATGAALGGGLINLLTNELNPAILPIIAANPHGILDPGTAAGLYARGFISQGFSRDDAAKGGMNRDRWQALVDSARAIPDLASMLELARRGHATNAWIENHLHHQGFQDVDIDALLQLRATLLSPEVAAQAQARNLVSPDRVRELARNAGLSSADGDVLMGLAGEPPDLTSIIMAWRRGIITEAQVDRAIIQGPIRNEWIPAVKALQEQPLSPSDAASAVTQGHLTLQQGAAKAKLSGITPEDFNTIVESSGLPPGIEFATEALNRGLIDSGQFKTMFLESRIKNRYIDLIVAMSKRLIPQETVRLLYRNGVYSREQTLQTLMGHGFTAADAASLLALEETRADDGTKELTRAEISDMYQERMLTLDEAVQALISLGYGDDDAHSIIELADLKRLRRFINAIVTKVRAAYVAGRIDEPAASSTLDHLGLPVASRDDLLTLWDIERTTVSKTLTGAQIRQAFKKGLIDESEAMARLTAQGYDDNDAGLYLQLTS